MSSQEQDRIRLADAMGWTRIRMKYVEMDEKSYPFGCLPAEQYAGGKVIKHIKEQIPDPFTDANDAWAVHEHMMASDMAEDYKDALFERVVRQGHQYSRAQDVTPWDWPRAALTALGGHDG